MIRNRYGELLEILQILSKMAQRKAQADWNRADFQTCFHRFTEIDQILKKTLKITGHVILESVNLKHFPED